MSSFGTESVLTQAKALADFCNLPQHRMNKPVLPTDFQSVAIGFAFGFTKAASGIKVMKYAVPANNCLVITRLGGMNLRVGPNEDVYEYFPASFGFDANIRFMWVEVVNNTTNACKPFSRVDATGFSFCNVPQYVVFPAGITFGLLVNQISAVSTYIFEGCATGFLAPNTLINPLKRFSQTSFFGTTAAVTATLI